MCPVKHALSSRCKSGRVNAKELRDEQGNGRLCENASPNTLSKTFDIREGAHAAFQWACGSGLIPDEGATSLEPNEVMSREEAVILLYDYAVLYSIDPTAGENTNILSYTDVFDMVQEQGYKAFQWTCGADIIVGTSSSTLVPAGSMTRAQLATVLMNLSTK